jgi:hypothetical protein
LLADLSQAPIPTADHDTPALPRSAQQQLDALVANALHKCLASLETIGLVGPANAIPSRDFWQVAGPLLRCGDLQWHARSKPLGYAGDFRMLDKILRHAQSPSAWGGAFDRFFQYQAAPQAVRNRTAWVAQRIVACARKCGPAARIVSVGSGPAHDILTSSLQLQRLGEPLPQFTLLDMDPYALEFVQSRLGPLLPAENLRLHRANLVKLDQKPATRDALQGADFIFCTGLLDYLEDAAASRLIEILWGSLNSGGELLIFNFSPHNASRSYMEWIGNWYLLHRDVATMYRLADNARLPSGCCVVDAEPQGVNLFLRAQRD